MRAAESLRDGGRSGEGCEREFGPRFVNVVYGSSEHRMGISNGGRGGSGGVSLFRLDQIVAGWVGSGGLRKVSRIEASQVGRCGEGQVQGSGSQVRKSSRVWRGSGGAGNQIKLGGREIGRRLQRGRRGELTRMRRKRVEQIGGW